MSDLVPEGWSIGTLPEYVEINPRLIQRAELEQNTQVSFIKMEDVSNNAIVRNVRVVPYEQVSKGFTTFQNKDVLLAKITPCFENGKGGFVDKLHSGVGFGSTEFHVLRAKENSDPRFIYQFTNYPEFRIKGESNMTGSAGQRRVPADYLRTFDVVFPPFHEQQKIATILSSVDNVIEKTRAQIDKLKDLKTGMMQELLTKGIGHTEFKDSPVGLVPMQWEIVKFEDVFSDYKYGPRFSSKDYSSCGNVKTIRGTDLSSDGEVHYNQVPTASIDAKTVESHRLRDGDLVMITTAECGSSAVFREQKMPYIASAYAIKLSPTDRVFPEFIKYFMQTPNAMVQIESFIRKGTVANLPGSDVMNIVLALPAYLEQKEIASMLLALDTKIARVSQKLAHVASIKKALMQDLLTGKVRVKPSDS